MRLIAPFLPAKVHIRIATILLFIPILLLPLPVVTQGLAVKTLTPEDIKKVLDKIYRPLEALPKEA